MSVVLMSIILLFVQANASYNHIVTQTYQQLEMLDLLDLSDRTERLHHPNRGSAASKFLLEVYNEINDDQEPEHVLRQRHRRSLDDDILISKKDRREIANANSILTFASRLRLGENSCDLHITFNTKDVPTDLALMQAVLRIYKQPSPASERRHNDPPLTVTVYRRLNNRQSVGKLPAYRILNSVNTTAHYKGWLELNLTPTLRLWLQHTSTFQHQRQHELRISVSGEEEQLDALDSGLVAPQIGADGGGRTNLDPFIVGYFKGPELIDKIQKLRYKRDLNRRRAMLPHNIARAPPPPMGELFEPPLACERLNFTVDFGELHLNNWVIAPDKFEAYFCAGGCNFPLGSRMNATNHAIVQTLMHLKQPHLPKPCCVPTVLGAITVLSFLNNDIINLTKYQQSVAKECGCH